MTPSRDVLEPNAPLGPTPAAAAAAAAAAAPSAPKAFVTASTGKAKASRRPAGNAYALLAELDGQVPAPSAPANPSSEPVGDEADVWGSASEVELRAGPPPDAWDA